MEEIAAGQGPGAEAVHDRQGRAPADARLAVESGEAATAALLRAAPEPQAKAADQGGRAARLRRAAARQARSSGRPPGAGWAHEIKFDGYRLQLRVEDGKAHAEDPQGPRLDGQVPGDRRAAARACPTA